MRIGSARRRRERSPPALWASRMLLLHRGRSARNRSAGGSGGGSQEGGERPGYSWYRLLRFWASVRFHATGGISLESMERRTRGLVAVLRRTKTSGPEKLNSLLPVFSLDAFVR